MVIGFYYFFLKPDYAWKDSRIRQAASSGWVLIDSASASFSINPIYWFKPPINHLNFIYPKGTARINDTIMIGAEQIINSNNENGEDLIGQNLIVCDCKNSKEYRWPKGLNFELGLLHNMNSIPLRRSIRQYLCSRNKYFYVLDIFGNEIDISNLMISGQYSSLDHNGRVYDLQSTDPYLLEAIDEADLRKAFRGLKTVLDSSINNSFNEFSDSLYKHFKYSKSDILIIQDQDGYEKMSIVVGDFYESNSHDISLSGPKRMVLIRDMNNPELLNHSHNWRTCDSTMTLLMEGSE